MKKAKEIYADRSIDINGKDLMTALVLQLFFSFAFPKRFKFFFSIENAMVKEKPKNNPKPEKLLIIMILCFQL